MSDGLNAQVSNATACKNEHGRQTAAALQAGYLIVYRAASQIGKELQLVRHVGGDEIVCHQLSNMARYAFVPADATVIVVGKLTAPQMAVMHDYFSSSVHERGDVGKRLLDAVRASVIAANLASQGGMWPMPTRVLHIGNSKATDFSESRFGHMVTRLDDRGNYRRYNATPETQKQKEARLANRIDNAARQKLLNRQQWGRLLSRSNDQRWHVGRLNQVSPDVFNAAQAHAADIIQSVHERDRAFQARAQALASPAGKLERMRQFLAITPDEVRRFIREARQRSADRRAEDEKCIAGIRARSESLAREFDFYDKRYMAPGRPFDEAALRTPKGHISEMEASRLRQREAHLQGRYGEKRRLEAEANFLTAEQEKRLGRIAETTLPPDVVDVFPDGGVAAEMWRRDDYLRYLSFPPDRSIGFPGRSGLDATPEPPLHDAVGTPHRAPADQLMFWQNASEEPPKRVTRVPLQFALDMSFEAGSDLILPSGVQPEELSSASRTNRSFRMNSLREKAISLHGEAAWLRFVALARADDQANISGTLQADTALRGIYAMVCETYRRKGSKHPAAQKKITLRTIHPKNAPDKSHLYRDPIETGHATAPPSA